jgi:hypothetical protein
MGCACLRGDSHHWLGRGAGRAAASGRQQGGLAHQLDLAGPDARPQLLRRGNPDSIRIRVAEGQLDAVPDPKAVDFRKPVGDRDCQRLGDSVPIADRHSHAVSVAERQPESVGLALGPL